MTRVREPAELLSSLRRFVRDSLRGQVLQNELNVVGIINIGWSDWIVHFLEFQGYEYPLKMAILQLSQDNENSMPIVLLNKPIRGITEYDLKEVSREAYQLITAAEVMDS